MCTLSSAARGPLGGRNGALPYITAQQRPPIPGVAGHCLVTLGDHTHTTLAHHYRSHEQRLDTVFDGSNCAQFGWRTVVCTPSLAARPPKVTTQCPAISLGCRRGPWDAEDDVHTTIQHPNCKIRCRQRRMWLCSGCGGLCPPPQVTKQCPVAPGEWGHCPQCPIAALHAEDGVHTTVRHPYRNSNRHKHGVGNAECGL